jgi:glycosyltransferase involved in cell wall biosynthesis
VSALYGFVRGRGVRLWTYSDHRTQDENVRYLKPFHLNVIPSLIREAFKARIIDSSYFAVEYPHKIFVPLWIAGKLLLRIKWVKIFLDGSLPHRYPSFNPIERLLFHSAIKCVAEFVVVNEDLEAWLRNEIGIRQKVTVIPCLLPMPAETLVASLPEDLDQAISGHAKQACSIGVFIPAYGFKEAAEAVEQIRAESGEDIGLILIDGAYVSDDDYRSEVLAGREWITVLVKVPQPLVLQILNRSNVFIRPFGVESYGISRVEAIWCGVPVVATNAGETRGMLLYNHGDQEGLVKQIKVALYNSTEQDVQSWATLFQTEAEQNLRDLIKVMGLEANIDL